MIKSHEIKNVTDFNVADSVRHDIKVFVTKTYYTVYPNCWRLNYQLNQIKSLIRLLDTERLVQVANPKDQY